MEEQNSTTILNTAESLQVARAYASLIGEIPSSFSTTLRTLIADEEKNGGKLSSNGRFLALRLLKSRGVLAPTYYAALTFRSAQLSALGGASLENLLRVFSPMDLAGMIGLLYFYRRVKNFTSQLVWDDVRPGILSAVEAGGHIGSAMSRIGMAMGTCVGGLGLLSLCLFQKQDEKAFKEYRRYLRSAKLPFDLSLEMSTWGCTRFNVSAVLMQLLGFGVPVASAYSQGLTCTNPLGQGLTPEAYRFKITSLWLDSLLCSGEIPNIAHKGEYYPTKAASLILLQDVGTIKQQGSRYSFLDKTKDDVSPEKTPQLFGGASVPSKEAEVASDLAQQIKDDEIEKI